MGYLKKRSMGYLCVPFFTLRYFKCILKGNTVVPAISNPPFCAHIEVARGGVGAHQVILHGKM